MIFDRVASPLLFGLAANTDNLAIGVAYGMKSRRIGWRQNLVIAIVTSVVTLASMALGRQIRDILPPGAPDILGGSLLLMFAAWNFYQERAGAAPSRASGFAHRPSVGMGESLFLAGTLSINNIGLAIASGIGGLDFVAVLASTCFFSIAMLAFGQSVGGNVARMGWLSRAFRYPFGGNAVLALAGVLMLAGY